MENNLPSTSNRTGTGTENLDHLQDLGEEDELCKYSNTSEANSGQEGIAGNRKIIGRDEEMIIIDQENYLNGAAQQHRVSSTGVGIEYIGSLGVNKGEVTVPEMEEDIWDGFEDVGGEVIMMDSPGRMDNSITIQV